MRSVFRNRWWTLAFAAFICWQAMDYAGTPGADNADAVSNADAKAIADALNAM